MQPRPDAEFGQPLAQRFHARLIWLAAPFALGVFEIDAIGTGVLRDHQQLLDAVTCQLFRLAQHLIDRPRNQIAAHAGNDAEAATMIAAFGNLQIGVVLRRELDADIVIATRHQVDEGIVPLRQRRVHGAHHAGVILRPADRQHIRVHRADLLRALAETTGDDHLAVFGQRLADGVERFGHCRVDETAGIDHHHIGGIVARHNVVTLRAQLGEDALGIDQRLGAAETDEAHFRIGCCHGGNRCDEPGRRLYVLGWREAHSMPPSGRLGGVATLFQ